MIISIDGNIGSGKSTLFKTMKEYFSKSYNCNGKRICFLEEPVNMWENIKDENGYSVLKAFYENQEKYAFPFQILAYISRLSMLLDVIKSKKYDIIVTERCVYSDRNVFARMLHASSKMNRIEWQIYEMWFDAFIRELPQITFVYLKTTPEVCERRIIERNREGEKIDSEYLKMCNEYHNDWLENECCGDEIIVLDGSKDKSYHIEFIDIIKQYMMWESSSTSISYEGNVVFDYARMKTEQRKEIFEECCKRAKLTHT